MARGSGKMPVFYMYINQTGHKFDAQFSREKKLNVNSAMEVIKVVNLEQTQEKTTFSSDKYTR